MSKAHVLIVDDDEDFAQSLAEVIEDYGHPVKIAHSGEEAVENFRAHRFDITLMDMKLPGMSGVESFAEFRKLSPDAKVVMMTGYSVEDLIRQAQDEGALAVFQKPIDLDALMKFIEGAAPNGGDVLLVDDDEDFVRTTEEFLKDQGYSVVVAYSGKEALEKLQTGNVRTLLLDLRMPIMSGLEVYVDLKSRGHQIPTIIMTAYRAEASDELDELQSMGGIGYLYKPFDPMELRELIESVTHVDRSPEPDAS